VQVEKGKCIGLSALCIKEDKSWHADKCYFQGCVIRAILDVQYGKIRVNYDTAYHTIRRNIRTKHPWLFLTVLQLYSCFLRYCHSTISLIASFVGLARTIYIYGVYTVFLAGKSLYIRSYTVHIYGSGQPSSCVVGHAHFSFLLCGSAKQPSQENISQTFVVAGYVGLARTIYTHRI